MDVNQKQATNKVNLFHSISFVSIQTISTSVNFDKKLIVSAEQV